MKTKGLILLATLILGMIVSSSCKKDNINDINDINDIHTSDVFFNDTIFFYGQAKVIDISFEEDGLTCSLPAFAGQAIVYFNEDVKLADAQKVVAQAGGKIIEQMPSIGYYLVSIPQGSEMKFVNDIYSQNANYAFLNTVSELSACPSAKAIILDAPYDDHYNKVSQAYLQSTKNVQVVDCKKFPAANTKGEMVIFDIQKAINFITKSYPEGGLYNISSSPLLERNGSEIKWKDATDPEKNAYLRAFKNQMYSLVKQLAKMRANGVEDIVVTLSAGNKGMPDLDINVIQAMVNEVNPKTGKPVLSELEKKVLSEQILIVGSANTDYSNTTGHSYYPDDPRSAAGGNVDINGMTYTNSNGKTEILEGTSFAAPKALAIIHDMMQETCINPLQAMRAAKFAISQNGGTLTYDKALSAAKTLYPNGNNNNNNSDNQLLNKTLSINLKSTMKVNIETYTCVLKNNSVAQVAGVSGSWEQGGNQLKIKWTLNNSYRCTYSLTGTLNGNSYTGTFTHYDNGSKLYDKGTFTGTIQ